MVGVTSLAEADFKHRIPVTGEDELALLASAFNVANMKLREQFSCALKNVFMNGPAWRGTCMIRFCKRYRGA
jgi:hypothetical protein